MNSCPECGNTAIHGKSFCPRCGTRLANASSSASLQPSVGKRQAYSRLKAMPGHREAVSVQLRDMEFIRQSYLVFFFSVLGMCIIGLYAYLFIPKDYLVAISVADSIAWVVCGWFGLRRPIIVVFPIFGVLTGLFLGVLAAYYSSIGQGGVYASAAILTLMTFASLTFYVFITKEDFSGLRIFLNISFFILLYSFLLYYFLQPPLVALFVCLFGTLVFCGWVLHDTSRILLRRDEELSPPVAAFELFLDIIGLFSYLRGLVNLDIFDN